jgi:hypothetical protein
MKFRKFSFSLCFFMIFPLCHFNCGSIDQRKNGLKAVWFLFVCLFTLRWLYSLQLKLKYHKFWPTSHDQRRGIEDHINACCHKRQYVMSSKPQALISLGGLILYSIGPPSDVRACVLNIHVILFYITWWPYTIWDVSSKKGPYHVGNILKRHNEKKNDTIFLHTCKKWRHDHRLQDLVVFYYW